MMHLKKIAKVFVIALVICVLMFSAISASAAYDPPLITYIPFPSLVATIPPTIFTFFTFGPFFTPAPSDTSPLVYFSDPHLRDALALELGVGTNQLTENYLNSVTGTLDLSGYGIEELVGIKFLKNLDYLILRDNPIYSKHEVKRLRLLTGLESLDISALSITSLPGELGDMSNLQYLDISANRVDALPSDFANLNLNFLLCNYCFFDIADPAFTNILVSATSAADYQYQLRKIDFYMISETAGTATAMWYEMPDIYFPNGAIAEVKRYSICKPNPSGGQGAWIDSASRSATSYEFGGLNPSTTYSFDISVDYYIKNSIYDGKYIKYYSKEMFKPIPQATPTPTPTATPEATPSPEPAVTFVPTPSGEPTSAPADVVTLNPGEPTTTGQTDASNSSFMTTILVLMIVLIVSIIGLIIVLFLKMNKPGGGAPKNK